MEIKIVDELILEYGIPRYANPGDAGLDIRACINEPVRLFPGEVQLIPSGIAIHLSNPNLVGKLYARSGLSTKHRIGLANSVGIIDSGYQAEIKVALWNFGQYAYLVQPGERIAQLIIEVFLRAELEVVSEFSRVSERGENGFGSSGKL